ncbi:MAG: hypothetical protein CVV56_07965 [Tenericutes bacterium HGW-Tenericutes-1]|jgi:hypothetical protein|nr:MAG: hypothetical protein CVV56_07965 [Tenericutes bacterium HGW-Tenericutes-1]PKM95782.1 MAG: hypothetical protein CVU84_02995 [Firmicutes bacterium HGW-Firmicutes-1]
MPSPPVIGNVVKEFMIGNTTIKICDDSYRDKTKEDVDRILMNISRNAYEFLNAQANKPS